MIDMVFTILLFILLFGMLLTTLGMFYECEIEPEIRQYRQRKLEELRKICKDNGLPMPEERK